MEPNAQPPESKPGPDTQPNHHEKFSTLEYGVSCPYSGFSLDKAMIQSGVTSPVSLSKVILALAAAI
ncbi:hypothetical protein ABIB17_001983 [Arthrobacter sp. UYEF6]